jgi:hypothetical protein
MDKYKDPYQIYYNRYSNADRDSFGYGNYGYRRSIYDENRYNNKGYMQDNMNERFDPNMYMNPNMQVPIQMPEEDYNGMDEMDKKKMRLLYPEICKKLQYYIEEECDKMDYSGSYMYDDYLEKEMVEMVTDKIYEKVEKDDTIDIEEFKEEVETKDINKDSIESSNRRCGYSRKPNKWLRNTIQVMLINEMYGRRCKRFRRRCFNKPICCYQPYYYRYPDFFE